MADKTIRLEPPEPVYTLFNTTRQDRPEILLVNRALLTFEHVEVFPWYLSVEIDYTEFADNEMPTPEENEVINRICDQIEHAVEEARTDLDAANSLFLARSTWGGIRELAFQVHDPDVAHRSLQSLLDARQWERDWRYEMKHDPKWENAGYFFQLFAQAAGGEASH